VTPEGWLVVVDLQHVFADRDSPWGAPRFAEIRPRVQELVQAFGDRVVWTRFVAPDRPAGAWKEYYEQFPWALQPPDAPLYRLVEEPGADALVLDAATFGKWGPELAAVVGNGPLTVAGVATDCCVISTVLPAADAGVPVRVVTDACAGSGDADHHGALRVMSLYAPLVELATTAEVLAGR
jgi:nicotinamidase-related amidase